MGRDLLVGIALGVFLSMVSAAGTLVGELVSGTPAAPRLWNGVHLFGARHTLSGLLRILPNALQGAMVATFAYVVLLALVRSRLIAIGIISLLFIGVVLAEGSADELWATVVFALLLAGPLMYVFVRFGLLAAAAALAANQALHMAPLTLDLTRPYAVASTLCILTVVTAAVYAFYTSRAGVGLFRRLLPSP